MDKTNPHSAASDPGTMHKVDDSGLLSGGWVSDVADGVHFPCFVAGTRIDTSRGPVAVEDIRVGDLVHTLDDTFQPVIGRSGCRVAATGALRPVMIPAGMFGDHGALQVSPQHRLSVAGWRAELCRIGPGVPISAADLVRTGLLQRAQVGDWVQYHRLMFDGLAIIRAEGLWSESSFPDTPVQEVGSQERCSATAFDLQAVHQQRANATGDPKAIRTRVA